MCDGCHALQAKSWMSLALVYGGACMSTLIIARATSVATF